MTFFMLLQATAIIFLNTNHSTTLVFQDTIEYISAGNRGDFKIYKSKNGKILVLRPLKKFSKTPMIVITNSRSYQFELRPQEDAHTFIHIKNGTDSRAHKLKRDTPKWKLKEGETSLVLINKTNSELLVNGIKSDKKRIPLTRGAPLFIEGKREY